MIQLLEEKKIRKSDFIITENYHGECGMCSDDLLGTMPYSEMSTTCESVNNVTNFWIDNNNCLSQSKMIYQNGDVICQTFDQCVDDAEVTLCTSENAGHTWPSMPGRNLVSKSLFEPVVGKVTHDISNDQIWEFLSKHSLE